MRNRLYIGNLEWSIDNKQLADFFGQIGTVISANVIMNRDTGRSRGFGFVEFETEKEAQKAIRKLNGIDFNRRNIVVNEARPEGMGPVHGDR